MNKCNKHLRVWWVGLVIATTSSGCTHNYYYGAVPVCPPSGQTVTTQVGQVCEVPAGTVVTSTATPTVTSTEATTTPAITSSNSRRIVISQPAYDPSLSSRLGWRKPNESLATTRVEGALGDSTVK